MDRLLGGLDGLRLGNEVGVLLRVLVDASLQDGDELHLPGSLLIRHPRHVLQRLQFLPQGVHLGSRRLRVGEGEAG